MSESSFVLKLKIQFMLFHTLTNEVIFKNKILGKVMICKAFNFSPAIFLCKRHQIQCDFFKLDNLLAK